MKFGSALFALTAVCLVRAAPNARRESNRNAAKAPKSTAANSTDSSDTKVVGSAYFINNDPAGNYIVVHNIEKNGNISWAGVVSAGGEGHHGEDFGLFASDATYSNRIISVHQAKGLLATTNTKSNTVALFRIDRNDPSQLMMLGEPQPSWGDFPTSVAFSNDGDRLCVMNAGKAAGILCYGVNDWGLAIQKESYRSITDLGYNQTTLPAGPINTVSQVIFTENDDALVVAIKGYVDPAPTRGGLIVWPIAENGSLAEKGIIASTPAPGGFPFSLTIMPGKKALFSADFSTGFDIFSFADGYENINNTANIAAYDIPGEITTCWSAYSPTLDRYYISDPTTDIFTEIAVKDDLSSASVIANHTILTGGEPIDIAVATIDGVDYLYSLLTTESSVGVLRLDAPGQSTIVGISNFTQPVRDAGAAATINFYQGMAVYVKSD